MLVERLAFFNSQFNSFNNHAINQIHQLTVVSIPFPVEFFSSTKRVNNWIVVKLKSKAIKNVNSFEQSAEAICSIFKHWSFF